MAATTPTTHDEEVRHRVRASHSGLLASTRRDVDTSRATGLLALAGGGLFLVDPLLAWSVGCWLSLGATAGVTAIRPWLAPARARTAGPAGCTPWALQPPGGGV